MLKFIDSFAHYDTADVTKKWTSATQILSQSAIVSNAPAGRANLIAMSKPNVTLNTTTLNPIICGMAVYWPGGGPTNIWANVTEASPSVTCSILSDGRIKINIIFNNYIFNTYSTVAIQADRWNFIEFKLQYVIDNESDPPTVIVLCNAKINGELVINNFSTGVMNGLVVDIEVPAGYTIVAGTGWYIKDFYVCDTSGDDNNDFLGDVDIGAIFPREDTAVVQWTPSAGTDHFPLVNEHASDEGVTHVSTDLAGNIDAYFFDLLVEIAGESILGLQFLADLRKDNVQIIKAAAYILRGANIDGAEEYLGENYSYWIRHIQERDPAALATPGWTADGVNASGFGVKYIGG